jgi:ribosomal protein L28
MFGACNWYPETSVRDSSGPLFMSETSRKFSPNLVHKWLKLLETRVVLLHVAASYVKPFQNICSRNTTFACRKASTNITNPSGVAQI